MDDRKAIKEIKKGNKEYLNLLAEKYYDDIYRFCCYQTGDPDSSYDLAQETFLRFIRYVDICRCKNLKGYLLTIARNVCYDYFGRETAAHSRLSYLPWEEACPETQTAGTADTSRSRTESSGGSDPGRKLPAVGSRAYEASQNPTGSHCSSQSLRSETPGNRPDHRYQFVHCEIPHETGYGQIKTHFEKGGFLWLITR